MISELIRKIPEYSTWRILQKELLRSHFSQSSSFCGNLSFYTLVHVFVDDYGHPKFFKKGEYDVPSFMVFTDRRLTSRAWVSESENQLEKWCGPEVSLDDMSADEHFALSTMMLGELVDTLRVRGALSPIKINPVLVAPPPEKAELGPLYFCEEVLFAPLLDPFTQKSLISDPEEAKALLSIAPKDQKRYGIEIVFSMITNKGLPEAKDEREAVLKEKIEEMNFIIPRVPIKKGSGSFLCILLNLDSDLTERAFIRHYKTFDSYIDTIFVTSNLRIFSGELEEIPYDGETIDTIFTPLIHWQQERHQIGHQP